MKLKSLLILLLTLLTTTLYAQSGNVKGRVVSRTGRVELSNVKVTMLPSGQVATTDNSGAFEFELVPAGDYTLQFEADEFEAQTIVIRVGTAGRDLNTVVLVPAMQQQTLDDSVFAEFDTETLDDAQATPTSLSASKDVFNNIASYKFSEMRFNVRGYDSQYQDVYLNGIQMNDAMTGYTPFSLWSGLNDAVRNQEVTSGLRVGDVGLGGIGGTTNVNTLPSQMRKGLRASLVNGNSMYRFRAMVTYASGYQDNGWSYAFSLSTRQGGNSYVNGVYYNAYGYFAAIEKAFNSRHRLSLMLLGAPTERGAQQASTQEVYDLVGNNYYNPNWGYQAGKKRNSRVRDYHEPIVMLSYKWDVTSRATLDLATSLRFGKNGYSALTWYSGRDPRPDYYRNLPSYYVSKQNYPAAAWLYEKWRANTGNIRYIDWDGLYAANYNGYTDETYGEGHRSNSMIEERHTDQLDWNFAARYTQLFSNNSKLTLGMNLRRNRTEYYSQIKDLLGGDYWVDIDKFAERDFPDEVLVQNDLDYYYATGHARAARKGDKYNYDYYAHLLSGRVWALYNYSVGGFHMNLGVEAGRTSMWREGLWRKGLFADNSKGNSKKLNYTTGRAKANFAYVFNGKHSIEANVIYMEDAPQFASAFISPRTRNTVTPGSNCGCTCADCSGNYPSTEKVFGVDASYNFRWGDIKARVSGYYTQINDQTKVLSYYDDVDKTYTNFAMSGIDKRYFGLEAALSVPLYKGLSLNGAVSWGQYTYNSNPHYTQMQDNSGEIVSEGLVYWKNFRVESTPQLAANVGLSYRSSKNIFLSVDFNYYDNMYLSMSPIYRTDRVLTAGMSKEDILKLRAQEKFDNAYTLNASIGKNWSFQRRYTLGFSLEVKNILNNQDIKTGGYEQVRLSKNTDTAVTTYQAFDSKYFYLFGTTYYLNLYFRF